MNPIVAIIAIVVVLILVMFGGRSEKTGPQGKDALVTAIEEYNAKSKSPLGGFHPTQAPANGEALSKNNSAEPHYPPYMLRDGANNPYAAANPYNHPQGGAQQPSSAQPNSDNSYYPPPPLSGQPASPLQTPVAPHSEASPKAKFVLPMILPKQANTTFHTPDGKTILFAGTTAYTLDDKGQPAPLPDGTYTLDGKVQIVVRGGHKLVLHD